MADSEPQEQEAAAEAKSGGMMGKLMIAGFMGGVILLESALAYLFIPSASDIADAAAASKEAAENEAEENSDEYTEVELGKYNVSTKQAGKAVSLRVDFELFGTVKNEDKADFDALYERNQYRFRHAILTEIRASTSEELFEPQLGLIKRRILEKSHSLFGKPMLRSIGFSDYTVFEQ